MAAVPDLDLGLPVDGRLGQLAALQLLLQRGGHLHLRTAHSAVLLGGYLVCYEVGEQGQGMGTVSVLVRLIMLCYSVRVSGLVRKM